MGPPGKIVSLPDASVPVHAHIRGAGEHEDPFVGFQFLKGLPGSPGHIVSVQIVHFVMADLFPGVPGLMVKAAVVLRVVGQAAEQPQQLIGLFQIQIFPFEFRCLVQHLIQPLFGVKNGGFIHVVPETVDAHIQKHLIFHAEPSAGSGIQHVRKVGFPGPYGACKHSAVRLFAEISLFHTFLVDGIAILHFDAGVDDGNQVDSLLFHIRRQSRKIREALF